MRTLAHVLADREASAAKRKAWIEAKRRRAAALEEFPRETG